MADATVGITIARPIEEVFAVLTDVEKTGTWFPGNVEEHWTSPPPHGVGSTRHAVVTVMGRRQENDATVTEYDPPHRGVMSGEGQGVSWTAALDFAPDGDGTRVEIAFDFSATGPMRLFIGLFLRWYRGQWVRGLATLKRMMETGEL